MKQFKNMKVFHKLLGIGIAAVLFFAIGLFGFVMPQIKNALYKQKQSSVQHLVDASVSLLNHYKAQVDQGRLSVKDAQEQAMENVRQLRFENGNYTWINDMDSVMLMHPAKPDMQGKNFKASKDANGKYIFQHFTRVCQESGSGFVEYVWPKPGAEAPVKKISYVKLFKPWGWIVGTGIYVMDVEKEISKILFKLTTIFLVCGAAAFIIAALVAKSITVPLAKGVSFAEKIADGDLTHELEVDQKDEIGKLAVSLNRMVKNLSRMFKDVSSGVNTLEISSADLAEVSEQMTKSAETASGNAYSVASASEQMSSNMNNVAAASEQASTNVNMVAASSEEMQATVGEIARNSENARTTTSKAVDQAILASSKMDKLGKAAQEISHVTEVITEISEQTNLIKELAKQTAQATGEIKQQISGIQNSTSETVAEIAEITNAITDVNEIVATIATSVEEQSAATSEITGNVTQASMGIGEVNDNVAQSSAAASEIAEQITGVTMAANDIATSSAQVNTNAHDLLNLSSRLSKVVGQFKTAPSKFDIAAVKSAHLKWRSRLEELLHGRQSLSPEEVASHHDCEFGKWYASPDGRALKGTEGYAQVGQYHEKVHSFARQVVEVMQKDDKIEAEKLMANFEDVRLKLFDALDELYLS